ncbi:MAG: YceI family protein [Chitinophagaceae bacterium]
MATKTWVVDPIHSEIQFKIKHLMITNVTGSFPIFTVTASTEEEDFRNAAIHFTADTASIHTGNEQRDGHLKSADFFAAEQYPQIKFAATKYSAVEQELEGDLTIKEVTKSVKLLVEFGGVVKDPYGNTKAGFTITGKINRKDFGLTWSAVTEAGGIVVSDEVRINCEIQLVAQ